MALRCPDVRVAAISVVAGNVDVRQATRNALYTVQLCGANVPVYSGADKPLVRAYQNATWFHGRDGLGDHNYPASRQLPESTHAVDAIIDTIAANPGLVLVTLGPLTNIALAVSRNPDIASNVSRCVVMGGAPCRSRSRQGAPRPPPLRGCPPGPQDKAPGGRFWDWAAAFAIAGIDSTARVPNKPMANGLMRRF